MFNVRSNGDRTMHFYCSRGRKVTLLWNVGAINGMLYTILWLWDVISGWIWSIWCGTECSHWLETPYFVHDSCKIGCFGLRFFSEVFQFIEAARLAWDKSIRHTVFNYFVILRYNCLIEVHLSILFPTAKQFFTMNFQELHIKTLEIDLESFGIRAHWLENSLEQVWIQIFFDMGFCINITTDLKVW